MKPTSLPERLRKLASVLFATTDISAENADLITEAADALEKAEAEVGRLREALKIIAGGEHGGQGWCYEPYGTRPCSCHVSYAREALQGDQVEESKP